MDDTPLMVVLSFRGIQQTADRNVMEFNRGKCKELSSWRNEIMHEYMVIANWLEQLTLYYLGVLADYRSAIYP